jgi:hypothetical protein
MKQMGIQAKIRRKKRFYGKKEVCVVSDNILNREFHATQPSPMKSGLPTLLTFRITRETYTSLPFMTCITTKSLRTN